MPVSDDVHAPAAYLLVRHALSLEELAGVLATATSCTQHHAVRPLDGWSDEELCSLLSRHLGRWGARGKPYYPHAQHHRWGGQAAARLWPLLRRAEPPSLMLADPPAGRRPQGLLAPAPSVPLAAWEQFAAAFTEQAVAPVEIRIPDE